MHERGFDTKQTVSDKVITKFVRGIFSYLVSIVLALPFSIGLPYLFWMLLFNAVRKNGTGGGLFWFPSQPDEFLWILCWLLVSLPFLIALFLLGVPIIILLSTFGINIDFVFANNTLVALVVGLIGQVLFWGTFTHLIRIGLRYIYFKRA